MVQTAQKLESARIVTGLSPKLTPAEQGKIVGEAWEQLRAAAAVHFARSGHARSRVSPCYFNLGPHPPRLWPEDVDLVHRLWLDLSDKGQGAKLRHRDIVGVALRRLEEQIRTGQEGTVLSDLEREVFEHPPERMPAQGETDEG